MSASLRRRQPRLDLWLTGTAFFLSGGAGLVYQVAWQRILALQSGVGVYSIAMIVAAFMAGLGVGSHWGGIASERLDSKHALRRFIAVELGIATFGVLSCSLYYDVLYTRASWLYSEPWRAGLLHFAALFLPTALMGMSLPYLSRAMVLRAETAGGTIAFLYGVNLAGAAAGAFLAPWVLIRWWGIRGAVLAAAGGNAACVLLAIVVATFLRRDVAELASPAAEEPAAEVQAQPFALWASLYALSGFCAISLEIVWFRLLDLALRSKAFTFGTLLCVYLFGSAAGCLAGAFWVRRLERPLRAFLICQCLLLGYAGVMVLALVSPSPELPVYRWLFQYWTRGAGISVLTAPIGTVLALYLGVPVLLFGPATVLMGLSFPILQRAVHDDPRTSGRKVGLLQAANIAGCVAGSLLVGIVALRWWGSTGTLRLLMVVGILFAALGIRVYGRRSLFAAAAAALLALAVVLPSQQRLWSRLHGTDDGRALFEEDATGLAAIILRDARWVVYVDGKSHSWVPFGGVHTRLGAMPVLVHRSPVDVAIIGLGSGDTAWASGCRTETRSVTVFEICGPQPRLLRRLAAAENMPELQSFLADPRVRVQVADGRNAVTQQQRSYDVIEADALWPDSTYSGNLYSVEFFTWCARRLKPGGILCTWAPTSRVASSFLAAMPHVIASRDRSILLGSNEPLSVDPEAWRARLQTPSVVAYLKHRRIAGIAGLLDDLQLWSGDDTAFALRSANLDLFPRDEFQSP